MKSPFASLAEETKLQIMKWSYLVIVIAATLTLAIVVRQNQILVENIQNDRKQLIYDNCLDQNARNNNLISFVNEQDYKEAVIAARKAGEPIPLEPPPIDPVVKEFIDVLAEKRNCEQLVVNIFGSPINESS